MCLDDLLYLCSVMTVSEVDTRLQVQMKGTGRPTDVCLPWLIPVPRGLLVGNS